MADDSTTDCDYCGEEMFPKNVTAKAHICRTCAHDIQFGDRCE